MGKKYDDDKGFGTKYGGVIHINHRKLSKSKEKPHKLQAKVGRFTRRYRNHSLSNNWGLNTKTSIQSINNCLQKFFQSQIDVRLQGVPLQQIDIHDTPILTDDVSLQLKNKEAKSCQDQSPPSAKNSISTQHILFARPGEYLTVKVFQIPLPPKLKDSLKKEPRLLSFRSISSGKIVKVDPKICCKGTLAQNLPSNESKITKNKNFGCKFSKSVDAKELERDLITEIEDLGHTSELGEQFKRRKLMCKLGIHEGPTTKDSLKNVYPTSFVYDVEVQGIGTKSNEVINEIQTQSNQDLKNLADITENQFMENTKSQRHKRQRDEIEEIQVGMEPIIRNSRKRKHMEFTPALRMESVERPRKRFRPHSNHLPLSFGYHNNTGI